MALTELSCKHAKPQPKPYKVSDNNGLYLEVQPNGGRYWRQRYTIHNKEKRISLGTYPLVSLADARERSLDIRKKVESGKDPSSLRQEEKLLAKYNNAQTFEAVAREWHELYKPRWSERHARSILYRLSMDVFPVIGNVPIKELRAPSLIACLRKIEARKAFGVATRTKEMCNQVLRYAVQTGRIKQSFGPDLRGALIGQQSVSFACIESKELPGLLKAIQCNVARLYPQTIRATLLMLLTFVRTSELINAKWSEFDLENAQWVIPAERMKMRRMHIVPLSSQAIKILMEQKRQAGDSEFVFPSMTRPRKPMSNNTVLYGLKRMGYQGKMTGHGFRALAMTTIKENFNYRHEVVDRQLAHYPSNKVDRAYDRTEFLKERKEMMQKWADYVDSL